MEGVHAWFGAACQVGFHRRQLLGQAIWRWCISQLPRFRQVQKKITDFLATLSLSRETVSTFKSIVNVWFPQNLVCCIAEVSSTNLIKKWPIGEIKCRIIELQEREIEINKVLDIRLRTSMSAFMDVINCMHISTSNLLCVDSSFQISVNCNTVFHLFSLRRSIISHAKRSDKPNLCLTSRRRSLGSWERNLGGRTKQS
jgi:hypothetical protein